eukprot:2356074-Amphidinium_carterae.1
MSMGPSLWMDVARSFEDWQQNCRNRCTYVRGTQCDISKKFIWTCAKVWLAAPLISHSLREIGQTLETAALTTAL